MKLAISNIAWSVGEEARIADLLQGHSVAGIEVAPTRNWPDLARAGDDEVQQYGREWAARGLAIPAIQAILFGRPDLKIFEDEQTRQKTLSYLEHVVRIGVGLGASVLVFGSPKNRLVGSLDQEHATEIAVGFFRRAGEIAASLGVTLCLEPNPPEYGCDFIRTVKEGIELVRRVGHSGFGLHIDGSAMILNGEDVDEAITEGAGLMRHFHISDPHLVVLGERRSIHARIAAALRRVGWSGWVSIEMRPNDPVDSSPNVLKALQFANEVYLA